jgi:hypothetical protein
MPLVISGRTIYNGDGRALKEIHCPKKVERAHLAQGSDRDFECHHCAEKVVNTDFMTEGELIALLEKEPSTCLFINLANPLFKVQR